MRPLFAALSLGFTALAGAGGGATVYVVVGADTSSVVSINGQHVKDSFENAFDMTPMSDGVFPTIFSEDFRLSHTDSRGDPIVFTWWTLTGGWHQEALNVDAVAATRVYQEVWGEQSDLWGDEIALHYHHFAWNGSQWVRAPTFEGTLWDFEWSISQLVLDSGVFPVSFRSGWNYMDNPYQQALERWIPFRLEGGTWMSQDVPYHPSVSDYRQPGSMRGWEVRHRYLGSLSQSAVDQIFDWAEAGQDQVTCLWSHQYESGFATPQISNANAFLHSAAASHPGVEFRYMTSREAMRTWQGSDDVTPPPLTLSRQGTTLMIESEREIFQADQPFVAARRYTDEYVRLNATPVEPGLWEVDPIPPDIDLLGVAVCDSMGNVTIRELPDGSRRWTSQTELAHAQLQDASALQGTGQVSLTQGEPEPAVEQLDDDSATQTLQRSYWIGQTFVPTQPGLTVVEVGALVTAGPATIRCELRTVGEGGFPDMSETALLAWGEGTLAASGDLQIDLEFSGFVLNGRQYALVFLREAGEFEIRLHSTGTYPGGNLVRAYSLDWIHIPAFDCRFQTFDQDGLPDQGQATHNGDAFGHESGRFITQTFRADEALIGAVEVTATSAQVDDILEVQLRRTLAGGGPNLSQAGLMASSTASVAGPGVIRFMTDWTIPEEDRGDPLALTFLSPEGGAGSIMLAQSSSDPFGDGALFVSEDTTTSATAGDLWFRVLTPVIASSGTLVKDWDSQARSVWLGGSWEAQTPPGTQITARFALAGSQAALDGAPWISTMTTTPFTLPPGSIGQWIRMEFTLDSGVNRLNPILEAFEMEYESEAPAARMGLLLR